MGGGLFSTLCRRTYLLDVVESAVNVAEVDTESAVDLNLNEARGQNRALAVNLKVRRVLLPRLGAVCEGVCVVE